MLDWQKPVDQCIETFREAGLARAALIWDRREQRLRCSHPMLDPLAAALAEDRDFDSHDGLFLEIGAESGHLMSATLHRTLRGQGAGGVRYWQYDDLDAFLHDGLRLSRGMGQKSALAGLWWGGGKGVIARRADQDHRDPAVRSRVFRDYGRFMSGLRGCYVTAEDVGTRPEDMLHIHATTRFTTCVPEALGGSGNPSEKTARGVCMAMEAALEHQGRGSLAGKRIAMQGLGNVATFMLTELRERDVAGVIATDVDPVRVKRVTEQFGAEWLRATAVDRRDNKILAEACDLLVPNAVGGILNPETIPAIKAPIVCGAANNQLEAPARDCRLLAENGVLFVPDFLANRMGIVNCANEQYGWFPGDPAIDKHLERDSESGVFQRTLEVLDRSEKAGTTPWEEAEKLADELAEQAHPIWGDRTRDIIRYLFESGWAGGPS
ncbi:MAG: Glu/Leu/Phe/Val dehydrogenase dimerization domain-containing protein [Xanthomonadales bacterium]|nr:Glu/Leu/Phe/Val dehydrogenase dimerization domain-containing protein [Xanthomonadales bacterium]